MFRCASNEDRHRARILYFLDKRKLADKQRRVLADRWRESSDSSGVLCSRPTYARIPGRRSRDTRATTRRRRFVAFRRSTTSIATFDVSQRRACGNDAHSRRVSLEPYTSYLHIAAFSATQAENSGFGEHVERQRIDSFLIDNQKSLSSRALAIAPAAVARFTYGIFLIADTDFRLQFENLLHAIVHKFVLLVGHLLSLIGRFI
jgi:hypothetical protein